jgi:hypothetical protein
MRLVSASVLGLAMTGGLLFTPSTSQAQSPLGVRVQVGDFGFSYNQGYPRYYPQTYVVPYSSYSGGYSGGCYQDPFTRSYSNYSYYPSSHHRHHNHHHHHHGNSYSSGYHGSSNRPYYR